MYGHKQKRALYKKFGTSVFEGVPCVSGLWALVFPPVDFYRVPADDVLLLLLLKNKQNQ